MGTEVGVSVKGVNVGFVVGASVGVDVGDDVGIDVGDDVGFCVGANVGDCVGTKGNTVAVFATAEGKKLVKSPVTVDALDGSVRMVLTVEKVEAVMTS